MTDFFSPTPSQKDLLTEKEFINLIKESPYVQPGKIMAFNDLIKIVGKPQREIPVNIEGWSGQINPRIKWFQWDLKNNKFINYTVGLSEECSDEEADLDNILEYGIVVDIFKDIPKPDHVVSLPVDSYTLQ